MVQDALLKVKSKKRKRKKKGPKPGQDKRCYFGPTESELSLIPYREGPEYHLGSENNIPNIAFLQAEYVELNDIRGFQKQPCSCSPGSCLKFSLEAKHRNQNTSSPSQVIEARTLFLQSQSLKASIITLTFSDFSFCVTASCKEILWSTLSDTRAVFQRSPAPT